MKAPDVAARSNSKLIWIAWEKHRRTLELSQYFGAELFLLVSNSSRTLKHPRFAFQTWRILHRHRPRVLIIQSPSIVLTFLACILKFVYRYRLVVDAHNEGISPLRSEFSWLLFLYKYFQRSADLTLVTNKALARRVRQNGGQPLVLPDKLPRFPAVRKLALQGRQNLAVVTTFAADEPFQEIFEAARLFPGDVVFHFTGDHRTARIDPGRLAPNVLLAGYLSDQDYWDLIASVDLVIDLTSLDDCLVCGAYEAVAAGTPLVLSDNEAVREYFSGGVVLTENSAGSIAKAVDFGLRRRDELRSEICRLKEELLLSWSQAGSRLKSELQQMCK